MTAVVTNIRSADQFVLKTGQGEITVGLNFVEAPRYPPPSSSDKEGPFAWDAREFVRQRLNLSRRRVMFQADARRNNVGSVLVPRVPEDDLPPSQSDVVDLAMLLVLNGLARVRPTAPQAEPAVKALLDAQKRAEEKKRGFFAAGVDVTKRVRDVQRPAPEELAKVAGPLEGKTINFIVEHVVNPTLVRGWIVPAGDAYSKPWINTAVAFAGVRPPKPQTATWEAARDFVENAILFRQVNILVHGVDTAARAVSGSVVMGKAALQATLLEKGLAQVGTQSPPPAQFAEAFRAAQQTAQNRKAGVWEGYEAPTPQAAIDSLEGTVVGMVSADFLLVQSAALGPDSAPVRVSLCATRAPREVSSSNKGGGGGGRGGKKDVKEEVTTYGAGTWDAREFVRTQVLGQPVTVHFERLLPTPEGATGMAAEPKFSGVVMMTGGPLNGKSVGAALVEAGLATSNTAPVRRAVTDNAEVLAECDALDAAQTKATAARAGVHGSSLKAKTVTSYRQLTDKKSNDLLSLLGAKNGSKRGFVEAVLSPTRYLIFFEQINGIVPVGLSGVMAPRDQDALAKESTAWARSNLHMRNVAVSVTTVDRSGAWVGSVTYHGAGPLNGADMATTLIREGLAVCAPIALRGGETGAFAALVSAEEAARKAKVGVWAPEAGLPAARIAAEAEDAKFAEQRASRALKLNGRGGMDANEYQDALVVWADTATTLYVQCQALTGVTQAMEAELQRVIAGIDSTWSSTSPPDHIKGGTMVAARSSDGAVYRARVKKVTRGKSGGKDAKDGPATVHCEFVDYGNVEGVPITNVRESAELLATVPAKEAGRGLTSSADAAAAGGVPFLARKVQLSFVRAPRERDTVAFEAGPGWVSTILVDDRNRIKMALTAQSEKGTYIMAYPASYKFGATPLASEHARASLQGRLLEVGQAAVDTNAPPTDDFDEDFKSAAQDYIAELEDVQKDAIRRRDRDGMWRHGDAGDDEDEY